MSILCRIGLHAWGVVGWKGLVMPAQVQQCKRCKCGREVSFDCTWRYTPEQMEAMLAQRDGGCSHEWIDATNSHVLETAYCKKCGKLDSLSNHPEVRNG